MIDSAPPLSSAALRLLVVLRNVPGFLECTEGEDPTPDDLRLLRATGATGADVRAALDFYSWGIDILALRVDAAARVERAHSILDPATLRPPDDVRKEAIMRGLVSADDLALLDAPGPFDHFPTSATQDRSDDWR